MSKKNPITVSSWTLGDQCKFEDRVIAAKEAGYEGIGLRAETYVDALNEGLDDEEHHAQDHRNSGEPQGLFAQQNKAEDEENVAHQRQSDLGGGEKGLVPLAPAAHNAEHGGQGHENDGRLDGPVLLLHIELRPRGALFFLFHLIPPFCILYLLRFRRPSLRF